LNESEGRQFQKSIKGKGGVEEWIFKDSPLERTFAFQVMANCFPKPEREFRFDKNGRKWRFDFAWEPIRVAIELEGGIWNNGRHVRGIGFEKDCEKFNSAQAQGWKVFRFTSRMINTGEAVNFLKKHVFRR